jgi:hypothetical protein
MKEQGNVPVIKNKGKKTKGHKQHVTKGNVVKVVKNLIKKEKKLESMMNKEELNFYDKSSGMYYTDGPNDYRGVNQPLTNVGSQPYTSGGQTIYTFNGNGPKTFDIAQSTDGFFRPIVLTSVPQFIQNSGSIIDFVGTRKQNKILMESLTLRCQFRCNMSTYSYDSTNTLTPVWTLGNYQQSIVAGQYVPSTQVIRIIILRLKENYNELYDLNNAVPITDILQSATGGNVKTDWLTVAPYQRPRFRDFSIMVDETFEMNPQKTTTVEKEFQLKLKSKSCEWTSDDTNSSGAGNANFQYLGVGHLLMYVFTGSQSYGSSTNLTNTVGIDWNFYSRLNYKDTE